MLLGIGRALVGAQRRVISTQEKAFYSAILNAGGPLVTQLVSKNLLGPHIRTIRRERSSHFAFSIADWASNLPQVRMCAA